jgi:succinoglycan biosynthesis transport protein ExoP
MTTMQRRTPSDVQDYWEIFQRRWMWFLAPALVVAFLTLVVSARLPRYYRSEAVLLVDPQKVPIDVVRLSSLDIGERLNLISQQVLSRTQLEKVIDQFQLYRGQKQIKDEIIDQMRRDITVQVVEDPRARDRGVSAFRLAFIGTSPEQAQAVTRRLASLYIEENLRVREQMAEGTHEFIDAELQKAREDLKRQEEAVTKFKTRYSGALPEQENANLQLISQYQALLQSNTDGLARAQQSKQYLQSLLEATRSKPEAKEDRLQQLRTELVSAEQRYTPNHPDIVRLRAQLKALEESPPSDSPSDATDSPQTTSQLVALDEEIKSRTERGLQIEAKVRSVQARIESLPLIQQQFTELNRDYEVSKANYQSLLMKKNSSGLSVELERGARGENFRILDPASLPERPAKPNLAQVNLLGLAFGLALGAGLTFVLEARDRSIHNERDLAHYVPLPVLGCMPLIQSPESIRRNRRARIKRIAFSSASVVTMLGIIAFLVYRRTLDLNMLF